MNIQTALTRFLVQLEADGRSPHTIGQYRRHVGAFAAWLPHGGHRRAIAAIRHEDIAEFLAAPEARTSAHGGPKQPVSMNSMRTSLRVFFRYLHEAGEIGQNPARLVRRAICGTPQPRSPPLPTDRSLIRACDPGRRPATAPGWQMITTERRGRTMPARRFDRPRPTLQFAIGYREVTARPS